MSATVSLALTAGMIAAINPCAFSLLPAYLGWFIDRSPSATRAARIVNAASTTAVMTLGFVATFTLAGLTLGAITDQFGDRLPWITITIGALVTITGTIGLVTKRTFRAPFASPSASISQRAPAVAAYGAVYALASLSCTIGPFLAVTAVASRNSLLDAVVTYLAYAVGMGAVVAVTAAAIAANSSVPTQALRRVGRYAPIAGNALMVIGGLYAVWYGRWELRVYSGDLDRDPVVSAVDNVRNAIAVFIDQYGIILLALLVLVVPAVVWATRGILRDREAAESPASVPTPDRDPRNSGYA